MIFRAFVLAAPLLFAGQAVPAEKELDKLQGTWVVLTNESANSNTDEDYNRRDGYRVVVKGNTWGWRSKSAADYDLAFRLDPRQPKHLDLDVRDGKPLNECIYEVDGDKLRICIAHFGQPRPEKLAVSKTASLIVLRRLKE